MSIFERLGRDERVVGRTRELAQRRAEEKVLTSLGFFKKSPSIQKLPVATVDALLTRLYDREIIRFTAQRERGLHNDPESIGPGIRALVTAEAVARFASTVYESPRRPGTMPPTLGRWLISSGQSAERIEQIKGEPISDHEWAAAFVANGPFGSNFHQAETENLYRLNLSAGAYRHVGEGSPAEGLVFHTYATFSEGRMVNSSAGFLLPVAGVVRIEGQTEGELWQNPALTPEGDLRIEQTR